MNKNLSLLHIYGAFSGFIFLCNIFLFSYFKDVILISGNRALNMLTDFLYPSLLPAFANLFGYAFIFVFLHWFYPKAKHKAIEIYFHISWILGILFIIPMYWYTDLAPMYCGSHCVLPFWVLDIIRILFILSWVVVPYSFWKQSRNVGKKVSR